MRKIALLIAMLALTACAPLQAALQYSTASVQNPVTREMLYNVENGMIVAFAGLNAYKQSCVRQLIAQTCRSTIAKVQFYTRQLPPLMTTLRAYVRQNDQVNAAVVYNTVTQLITQFKAVAASEGIPQGAQ